MNLKKPYYIKMNKEGSEIIKLVWEDNMKRFLLIIIALLVMGGFFGGNSSLEDASEVLWEQAGQEGSCVAVLIGAAGDESYC